ncbi:MAG: hypothetical protein Q7T03_05125 [Deltaproteobacteria bacterium]|nr:hypothetical protein [Deltaproteobacteria bacterium]
MIPINLLIEDALSQGMASVLMNGSGQKYDVKTLYANGGFGYIKSNIRKFNQAATYCPYFVMTDLDTLPCASLLRDQWFSGDTPHVNMIFRVAIREVEAWVLADREKFAQFLGIKVNLIPTDIEAIKDPKATLISLAQRSRFRILREKIVPDISIGAQQGPDYNGALISFLRSEWRLTTAMNNSPSLKRALNQLRNFKPTWRS